MAAAKRVAGAAAAARPHLRPDLLVAELQLAQRVGAQAAAGLRGLVAGILGVHKAIAVLFLQRYDDAVVVAAQLQVPHAEAQIPPHLHVVAPASRHLWGDVLRVAPLQSMNEETPLSSVHNDCLCGACTGCRAYAVPRYSLPTGCGAIAHRSFTVWESIPGDESGDQ